MNKIKVLVVDDSSFMRSVITRQIEKDTRMELVGTASNGREAVEKAMELKPDIITLDIEMPVMNGMDALKEIMEKCPTRVVMVSSLTKEGAEESMKALELGAVDFFPKAMDDTTRSIFNHGEMLRDKIYGAATVHNICELTKAHEAPEVKKSAPQPESRLRFKEAAIVLVGISTGGPKALHSIAPFLPAKIGVPMVIVQHMPPNFTAAMAQRLDQLSKLKVQEAADGMKLEPDNVYIVPGGTQCRIKKQLLDAVFQVQTDNDDTIYKPSVEVTAESIFEAYHGRVMAIMMTGMGRDGINGFRKLKGAGAYVIAQNEATCVVYGMPKAVVDEGLANEVLPLNEIPGTIERLLS